MASTPPPLPPRNSPAPPPQPPRKPSNSDGSNVAIALGVTFGFLFIAGIIGVVIFIALFGDDIAAISSGGEDVTPAEKSLLEDRAGHETSWTDAGQGSGESPDEPPEGVFELIRYPSPGGDLAAYVTPDPGDGKRHPAMVWAKGGFGGIGSYLWEDAHRSNDQSAGAFRKAGIVLMCPSWRGEMDNPGRFELFYGEVDDYLAAIEHVKTLPYVDPDRVYIGGHSTGGTLVLLAAAAGADYRAAFSFGGAPNMETVMADGDGYGNTPYDIGSVRDHQLRSAIRYTSFISRPTFYFEGLDSFYVDDVELMGELAQDAGVPFEAFILPGDHFDILAPVTKVVAEAILADRGDVFESGLAEDKLAAVWREMHEVSLASQLPGWDDGDPESLEVILDDLGDDGTPGMAEDIDALEKAIRAALDGGSGFAARATNVRLLGATGDHLEDDEMRELFVDRISPVLRSFVLEAVELPEASEDDVAADILYVVSSVAEHGDEVAGNFVADMVATGFASDSSWWPTVFGSFETGSPGFDRMMSRLGENPPGGRLGAALIESANKALYEEEWEGPHPYDNEKGASLLGEWLTAPATEEKPSFGAAFALAFVSPGIREPLVDQGLAFPNVDIAIEVAWSDLKHGGKRGLAYLQEKCLDPNHAETARFYMEELEHEDDIPEAALEPKFVALSEMIDWLKHPNEIGAPPETIELYDSRTLFWPPSEEETTLYLYRFTYRFDEEDPFDTGYGLTGGLSTWSSFLDYDEPPAPLDLYTHHCAFEENREREEGNEITDEEARDLLLEKNPGVFE